SKRRARLACSFLFSSNRHRIGCKRLMMALPPINDRRRSVFLSPFLFHRACILLLTIAHAYNLSSFMRCRTLATGLVLFIGTTLASRTAVAARLPLRQYTAADGLANNSINHIASDRRGFLWFATSEGLSRFDGYSFANLTTRDGLPHKSISTILIDHRGTF